MEMIDFFVHEDFMPVLADRFDAFFEGLEPSVIVIDIESNGGEVLTLERMELKIKEKKEQGFIFVTLVENYAYSCGLFLFLLGDIRLAEDSAEFMYHSAGLSVNQRVTCTDLEDMLSILKPAELVGDRIIAENTNLSKEMGVILKKNENYLSKSDLIFLGLMDENYELN